MNWLYFCGRLLSLLRQPLIIFLPGTLFVAQVRALASQDNGSEITKITPAGCFDCSRSIPLPDFACFQQLLSPQPSF